LPELFFLPDARTKLLWPSINGSDLWNVILFKITILAGREEKRLMFPFGFSHS
jgi:hypothetical protein